MFCPNCGTKNEDNSAFCANCGMKMGVSQHQNGSFEGNFNTTQNYSMGMNNNIPYQTPNMMNGPVYPNNIEPKKSKTVPVVISIIAVLIIIVGIIITILLMNSDDDKKREVNTTKDNKIIENMTTTKESATKEPTTDETTTKEPTTDEPTTKDMTDTFVQVDNVSFVIPSFFEKNDTLDGSYLRCDNEENLIESIYYYVQTDSLYTEEQMREAYRLNVESVYGDDYDFSTYYVGNLEFDHYSFETGTLVPEYYSEVYVYSDGNNTIYFESVILDGEKDTSTDILDTVTID